MSSAADIVYGRRGGRWVGHNPGRLLAEIRTIIARARAEGWEPPDLSRLFHPETIAASRAHQRRCGGCAHQSGDACSARPDWADVAEVWAGRARMAAARRAAGQPLDHVHHQALARVTNPGADH